MTTLFYKALISQGEIWCWSLLGLKVTWLEKRSFNNPTIMTWMGGRSHYKFYGGGVWTSWVKIIFTAKNQHFIIRGGSRGVACPPPPLFLDQTCTKVLLLLVKSWNLERYIVLLLKKPSALPWSFKPQYQHAYSSSPLFLYIRWREFVQT